MTRVHLSKRRLCRLQNVALASAVCILMVLMFGTPDMSHIFSDEESRFVYKDLILKKQFFPGIETLLERNAERVKWAESVCEKHKELKSANTLGDVWVSEKYSMAFCVVPKNGCTYWKQIFRFLENDHSYDVQYPSDIDRYAVHFDKTNSIKRLRINHPEDRDLLEANLKFMFARDPYSRLWSAYLDKFVLPDFWRQGINIVRELRDYPEVRSVACGHDVTFAEFLRFICKHTLDNTTRINEHFKSIVYNCNVCKLKFDIIGKTDTFKTDSDLIFMNTGLVDAFKDKKQIDAKADEIANLIDYNMDFKYHEKKRMVYPQDCFNDIEIAQRLWTVFQFNGYIGELESFPEGDLINISDRKELKEKIKQIILYKRKVASKETLVLWYLQRIQSMQSAYRRLPNDVLQNFQEIYSLDFELFKYEKYPSWLKDK